MNFTVAALYHFASFERYRAFQPVLEAQCEALDLCGTLLLASEGINGTIAGSRSSILDLIQFLRDQPEFRDLEYKESTAEQRPFRHMRVRLKKEIVTMGVPSINPARRTGQYVDAEAWNELIARDDVILIDARNDYEYRIGHFEKAIDPQTVSFGEFPQYVEEKLEANPDTPIAMYCTGGIRCEKASAYLLEKGYQNVSQLKGGILRYLETVPVEESLWKGECFVFDGRVSVGHGLQEGDARLCFGCKSPLTVEQRQHPAYEEGVSCEYCLDQLSEHRRDGLRERIKQLQLAQERGVEHMGKNAESRLRKKS
tara:strand:+ start:4048 stop:4983 length:936 start_codon:yes stop_codon:yes gene_type:complete